MRGLRSVPAASSDSRNLICPEPLAGGRSYEAPPRPSETLRLTHEGWGVLVGLAIAISAISCQGDARKSSGSATSQRSEVVEATASRVAATPPVLAPGPSRTPAQPARRTRKLCELASPKQSRELPRRQPSRAAAPGEAPLPPLASGGGRWTWINLWAAWCGPCKQELPRIRAFAAKLTQSGRPIDLAFVSLDDDERQLEQYLRNEPALGLRSSYWLREGRERSEWLADAGIGSDPQLPVQLLLDPHGRIRCTVLGAIEDEDYPEILGIVAGG